MITSMMLERLFVHYLGLESEVSGIVDARHNLFVKAKSDLNVLPLTIKL